MNVLLYVVNFSICNWNLVMASGALR